MQFTKDEITLVKSAALNRYLQLGFTEKDAEVLYGNFISNISNSKPKEAQLSKKAQSDLYDKINEAHRGAFLGGGVGALGGALGGGLVGLFASNNDAGFRSRLDRVATMGGRGALIGGSGGALGGGLAGLFRPNNDARVRERELDLENALRIELEALNKYIEEHQSR